MPIVVRRGHVIAEPRSRLLRFERPTFAAAAAAPVGIEQHIPDPRHELARLAVTRGECSGPADRTGPTAGPATEVDPVQPPGPVRVAYAIRWLELGDGRRRPPWESLVAGPVEPVSGVLVARDDQRNGEISR